MTSKESRERGREREREGVVFLRSRGLWSKHKHDAYSRSNGQSF